MIDDLGTIDWAAVWIDVAEQLAAHRSSGRKHLLTEDTVRMSTVLALQRAGIEPASSPSWCQNPSSVAGNSTSSQPAQAHAP